MYPHSVHLFSAELPIWNAMFLLGTVLGYPVLLFTFRLRRHSLPRFLVLRWALTVYVSALGAQLFAYLFDLNTTALPPAGVSWLRYYFDPLYGAKTLYGAIVFLPVTALAISVPWRDLGYGETLDLWTPAMFAVLGTARVGCLLQGCCYGVQSETLGVSFPPHSAVYFDQLATRLIAEGSSSLPVVPTQALSAAALFALCFWSLYRMRARKHLIFIPAVAAYSVFRFAVEILRADPDRNAIGPLSTSQVIALLIVTAASAHWLWRQRSI